MVMILTRKMCYVTAARGRPGPPSDPDVLTSSALPVCATRARWTRVAAELWRHDLPRKPLEQRHPLNELRGQHLQVRCFRFQHRRRTPDRPESLRGPRELT